MCYRGFWLRKVAGADERWVAALVERVRALMVQNDPDALLTGLAEIATALRQTATTHPRGLISK